MKTFLRKALRALRRIARALLSPFGFTDAASDDAAGADRVLANAASKAAAFASRYGASPSSIRTSSQRWHLRWKLASHPSPVVTLCTAHAPSGPDLEAWERVDCHSIAPCLVCSGKTTLDALKFISHLHQFVARRGQDRPN